MVRRLFLNEVLILTALLSVTDSAPTRAQEPPQWEVVSSSAEPVIGPSEALEHGIFQGFETGQYMKIGNTHYYVANELGLCQKVTWDKTTRAALWSAPSGTGPWTRVTTLRNTSSMHTLCNLTAGEGLRNAASWAPTLVFAPSIANGSKPVWNFFYSAGEAPKNAPGDGIVHAVSTTESMEGPYVDLPSATVPASGVEIQSSHAFTAWQLPNGTYMSFRNNVPGAKDFSVGLERAVEDQARA